jgi:Fe-S-cluster containining protein
MEGDMLLKHVPCKFYKDKKCMIYPSRPEICASYPNLHKTEVSERIVGIMNNYAICPIVFNVIEELKVRVGFKG